MAGEINSINKAIRLRSAALLVLDQPTLLSTVLDCGADPNTPSPDTGNSVLQHACWTASSEVVSLLLDRGGDPNRPNLSGWTAVVDAALRGRPDVLQVLLERGGDPNAAGPPLPGADATNEIGGFTATMMAASRGHSKCLELLLNYGADPDARAANGVTALILAAQEGMHESVELLLTRQASVDLVTTSGTTAAFLAAAHGKLRSLQVLHNHGANLQLEANGSAPLWQAALRNHAEVVRWLLATVGLDPNVTASGGITALMVSESSDITQLLLAHGANPHAETDDGLTALALASSKDDLYKVQLLRMYGAIDENALLIARDRVATFLTYSAGWPPFRIAVACRLPAELRGMLKTNQISTSQCIEWEHARDGGCGSNTRSKLRALASNSGLLWPGQPGPCQATIQLTQDALSWWSPTTNWLYPFAFREVVHTVLLVSIRLRKISFKVHTRPVQRGILQTLPSELWILMLGQFLRSDWEAC